MCKVISLRVILLTIEIPLKVQTQISIKHRTKSRAVKMGNASANKILVENPQSCGLEYQEGRDCNLKGKAVPMLH
jgi:hypothetical protein